MANKKIGVYICKGCEIGDSLDIEAVQKAAIDGVEAAEGCDKDYCRSHDCLCGDEGVELIKKDIGDGVNSVLVAACSQRYHADTFAFDGVFTERVNLREQVVWSHEPNDEDTQMLAEDYVRMGLGRANKADVPEPFQTDINKTVLVVGGGITGMTAANEAAKAGYEVVLVEKEAELGGMLRKFGKSFPTKPPYEDLQDNIIPSRVGEVTSNDKIKIHLSATIDKISGQPGQFDVSLKANGSSEQLRVGSIIQATGWKPYEPSKLGHLGYGSCKNVITNIEMEQMLGSGKVIRPSDGKPPKNVIFIQCAGSRDKDHLPYCSSVCCRVSLKQALQVRELDEDAKAYILYKDIRSPGQYEVFYAKAQEDPGLFLTKGEITSVKEEGENVLVEAEDTLIDKKIQVEADLVVLAAGMVPNAADGEAVREYNDALGIIAKGEEGAQLDMAKETAEKYKDLEGTEILNLDYRQGPDLPVLKYNFPDSHFICFPYETRRSGIYTTGCVRAPNDSDACQDDAIGAALKSIQSLELASRGEAVHPRWGDTSYPDFNLQRCTQCKRCTEECPFGVLNEDEKGTPQPNPTRCRRCGICLGACPERIISFSNYSPEIIGTMVKSSEIPDEDEEKPRLLGLICENDALPALDMAGLKRLKYSAYIRFIPVRCLGSVNVVWIADALSKGYDGILLVGCKSGDDYQCHFIRGSALMGTRGDNIQEKLKQLALEEERVRVEEVAINDEEGLVKLINEFSEQVEEVGLNPFKGF